MINLPPLFVNNRRDGARLLSSALVIFTIASTQLDHAWGQAVAALSVVICIYWGMAYRRLDR
ncbi:hypothetical protein [Prochlorococcus sp. MIT 1201]|uniref:hypothetical protein n=1 Tax=Prochlorococcus sp. MIT 1201 TaxID=3082535 RepID=UPI0039A52D4F